MFTTSEYPDLPSSQLLQEYTPDDVSTTAANLPENKIKNRYPDALPCKDPSHAPIISLLFITKLFADDHARVKLSVPNNESGSDYINASFIVRNLLWQKHRL